MSRSTCSCIPQWQHPAMVKAAGQTLRPGGFALTDKAVLYGGLKPRARVLDVGCGNGASVRRLRARHGLCAFGVDYSAEQVRAGHREGLPIARGDGTRLPVCTEAVEAVFSECVLSLIPDASAALGEFWRVLKPEGLLVLADLVALHDDGRFGPGCVQGAFSQKALLALLDKSGFRLVLQQDHSAMLAELAARIVFAGGSACGTKTGYMLFLAQKRIEANV